MIIYLSDYFSMFTLYLCFSILFIGGWVSTYFFRKQLLVCLISLEFLVLALFLGFVMVMSFLNRCIPITLYLLVIGACEATLGLCMLVNLVRLVGNDTLREVQLIKC
jgi:NADH:ubiquinone oxidoreductase subunit K